MSQLTGQNEWRLQFQGARVGGGTGAKLGCGTYNLDDNSTSTATKRLLT